MSILTYFFALLIGLVLGLTGGGGSILTVPVLVYLAGYNPIIATGYSLFIVGSTAFAGAINYATQKLINFKAGIIFAIPSFIAVFFVRKFVIPHIPHVIYHVHNIVLTKDVAVMILFAILMLISAYSMIRDKRKRENDGSEQLHFHYRLIATQGFATGIITGLLGAGGGFIIVPALVLLTNLPMKLAIGTSLFVIAINSLIGFIGDWLNIGSIDWLFLLTFSSIAIVGVLFGSYLSRKIPAHRLKSIFGYFLIIVALYIIIQELILKK